MLRNGRFNPYVTIKNNSERESMFCLNLLLFLLFCSVAVHAFHVKSLASKIKNVLANGDSSFIVSVEGCKGTVHTVLFSEQSYVLIFHDVLFDHHANCFLVVTDATNL